MNWFHALLTVLVLASILVGLWWRARWPKWVLAAVLLVAHTLVLGVFLPGVRAREVATAVMQADRWRTGETSRLIRLVSGAQDPGRVSLALTGLGLFALAVLIRRSQR